MILKNKLISITFILITLLCATSLFAEINIPARPRNHVVDLANIIDENMEAGLNRYLLELEQKTTAQMVILTISSLEGGSIDDLAITIANDKWKLGQKGKDNGALLLVSLSDRKYRFEIGYGLEGVVPDSLAGSIGRQYLVPYFKQGDYSKGITAASLAMINEIASEAGVAITGMPILRARPEYANGRRTQKKPPLILIVIFLIGFIYMLIRHPRLLLMLVMMNMLGGGRRSSWDSGGGFGGGSFGGGGGGGFGGGGASGGW